MPTISFFEQDISFKLKHPGKTRAWIKKVIHSENQELAHLNFIFCSDTYLLTINQQYLNHNTYTDIITFDNRESDGAMEGDIFISIDRIKENAEKLGVPFDDELHRVIIHGVLHLLGYGDKTPAEKSAMRKKEDACLSLRQVRD